MEKLEWRDHQALKTFDGKFICFDTLHQSDRHDRQTAKTALCICFGNMNLLSFLRLCRDEMKYRTKYYSLETSLSSIKYSADLHQSKYTTHAVDMFNELLPVGTISVVSLRTRSIVSEERVWQVVLVGHVAVVTQVIIVTHSTLPAKTSQWIRRTFVTPDAPVRHTWDNVRRQHSNH